MKKKLENRRLLLKCSLLLLAQLGYPNTSLEANYYDQNRSSDWSEGYFEPNSWQNQTQASGNWYDSPPPQYYQQNPPNQYYQQPISYEQQPSYYYNANQAGNAGSYYEDTPYYDNSPVATYFEDTPYYDSGAVAQMEPPTYDPLINQPQAAPTITHPETFIPHPTPPYNPEPEPAPAIEQPNVIPPTRDIETPPMPASTTPPQPITPQAATPPQEAIPPAPPTQPIQQAPTPQAAPAAPPPPTIITPTSPDEAPLRANVVQKPAPTPPTSVGPINFNNVAMIEYIRFISRISNKNFIFEDEDLQFTVTIVSEEPTSVTNLMTALLQELKIRDLSLIEQGNSIIIHRNPRIRSPGHIVVDGDAVLPKESEIVTRVFRLNTLDPLKATEVIKPLLSDDALVEVLRDSNNLIITDLLSNVNKIAQLIGSLDAPNSGVTVGQFVVRNGFVDSLVELATSILFPIAQGNPFVLVPHPASNSIFIVSNPYIVEKALAILQNLDNNEGKTKIFTMDRLSPTGYNPETGVFSGPPGREPGPSQTPILPSPEFPPLGRGQSVFNENSEFLPGGISAASRFARELPAGHIERTVFFIYKLKYRRGDQIDISLRKIASSLMATGIANIDLVSAINSVQWIESSNSLIFTGTVPALEKIKDLIVEVDTPLHQVYIEMLILDTTLEDSLTYGVNWGVLFGGGNTAGGETFLTKPEANDLLTTLRPNVANVPDAKPLLNGEGFNLGIIGKHLTHHGTHFSTISALVRALHEDTKAHVILNPRIITEDNVTAEVFVGETDRYKSQSISNDQGRVITNNFQFIDVGTTLRVTPLIGNNGVITLDIIEENTTAAPEANQLNITDRTDVNLVTVLRKNRSTTRLHVPNGFFVVMSGIIRSDDSHFKNEIPCLGMIPILGGACKFKKHHERKRNLMIFIRPLIVDTEAELETITKRQQDVYRDKGKLRRNWNTEIDYALDYFNVVPKDPDEVCPQLK